MGDVVEAGRLLQGMSSDDSKAEGEGLQRFQDGINQFGPQLCCWIFMS